MSSPPADRSDKLVEFKPTVEELRRDYRLFKKERVASERKLQQSLWDVVVNEMPVMRSPDAEARTDKPNFDDPTYAEHASRVKEWIRRTSERGIPIYYGNLSDVETLLFKRWTKHGKP